MDKRRRRILAVIGALPLYIGTSPKYVLNAKQPIPIEPPVSQPPPPEIQRAMNLITSALGTESEDKSINLEEMYRRKPELKAISDGNVNLALQDLLWRKEIEEIDDKTPQEFRLPRSGAG